MSSPESKSVNSRSLVPWVIAIAFFMEALDTTILNTAVPVMAKALHVLPLGMKSVLSSYTLSLALFIPVSNWFADRYGTRRVFASAIGLFTLGSILCGLATNIQMLVLFRILQGCGGAMMVPVGRLTLVRTFAKSELVRTMSFVAIPALIGPMIGPLAGGLIVGLSHWRMIFFVNVPIGILGLYFVLRLLPDFRVAHRRAMDVIGLVLFGGGVTLLSYLLEVFGETSLTTHELLGLFSLAIVLLLTYGLHASRATAPLIRLGLLRIRTLRASVGGNFFTRLGAGGMPFLLPLLYQVGLGFTPIQSGLLIMPQSLSAIVFRFWMPNIISHFGYRRLLLGNTVFMGLTMILFSTIYRETPVWLIVVQACAFGFFSSLQYTSMNTLAYADISDTDTSMASTILSTVQQLSMSFGVATSSLVAALFVGDRYSATSEVMIQGLHKAFVTLGFVTIFSAFGFLELKVNDGDNVSHHSA